MIETNWVADIAAFERKFWNVNGSVPHIPTSSEKMFKTNLIIEEFVELLQALDNDNITDIADGGADLIYVILGMLHRYGIDASPLWDAIHKANMQKEGGAKRADGKLLKPLGWKHPDISTLLHNQGYDGPWEKCGIDGKSL